jgi:PAS domain S-box-containing protein
MIYTEKDPDINSTHPSKEAQPHVFWQILEIVQTTADVVISIDKSEKITFINPSVESVFGYKPQDLIGKPLSILIPPTYRSSHSRHIDGFKASGDGARLMALRRPVYGIKKDGQMVPLEISILKHQKQGPFSLTAMVRDISDRVSQQTQASESERRYRSILESRTKAILLLTTAGRIIDVNGIVQERTGLPKEAILGRHIWEAPWWHGEERRGILRDLIENIGPISRSSFTMDAEFADNVPSKINLTLKASRVENENIDFIVAEWQDHESDQASGATSHKFKSQMDLLQRVGRIGSWEMEMSSGEVLWSEQMYHIFGLSPKGHKPTFDDVKKKLHPDDRDATVQVIEEAISTGSNFTVFTRLTLADNVEKMIQYSGEVLRSNNGTPLLIVGTAQDISESWLRETEITAALQLAETASLAKSRFLANLGHELRTPLNAVIGFSELIGSHGGGLSAEKSQEYAGYISSGGQKLLTLVNDIILASQLEASMITLQEDQTNLQRILELAIRPQEVVAKQKNVTIETVIPDDLIITADERLLVQAVSKIIANAIKFGLEGGVVSVWGTRDKSGVHIIIEDNGPGISKELIDGAYQPFFQVDDELSRRTDGIGLGLMITREIVKLHDGGLRIEKLPNQGTSVKISLPLKLLMADNM